MLSCSFGKDSLATAIIALEHGEPLTEAMYCEAMFDKEISAEVPEHRAFIFETAIPWLESNGIKVHVVRGEKTFVDLFQKQIGERGGKNEGKIWAWPLCGRCYINRDCKVRPMERYKTREWKNDTVIQYIGIADDEADRLARLDGTKKCRCWGNTEKQKLTRWRYARRRGCILRRMSLQPETAVSSARMQSCGNCGTYTTTTQNCGSVCWSCKNYRTNQPTDSQEQNDSVILTNSFGWKMHKCRYSGWKSRCRSTKRKYKSTQ